MNLLVLTNLYPPHYVGGYELHCQLVSDALRSRGHNVHVLTSDHTVAGVELHNEQHVTRMLKVHGLFGNPFLNIFALHALEKHNNACLQKALLEHQPDVVFVWAFAGLSKSMLHTLQQSGIPTVFAVCDHWIARSEEADVWLNWWNKSDGSLAQKILRKFWETTGHRDRVSKIVPTAHIQDFQFKRLYFCSDALRRFTASAGFDVSHGEVIYCPLDTQLFSGAVKSGSHPMVKLLYAGRLHEDKGVLTALRALSLVQDKFAGQLSIYGSGDPTFESQLRSYVHERKLPVTFHGAVSPADMPSVYKEHDALLFTSEWEEPFALTPLEAMACGLPVIATMTGGSAELFRHRDNAMTYTAGNAEELAQCILELDGNPSLRERIALTGHEEVRIRFNAEVIVSQVEDYLCESAETKTENIQHVLAAQ